MGVKKCLPITSFLLLSCIVSFCSAKYVIRLRVDAQCPTPGYFRDETDCRKFYRCAEHPTGVLGQNYITRSEFNCPPGTIFDEALSSCNHVMFVHKHNIPPGCDVSGAIVPSPNGDGSSGSSSTSYPILAADSPLTSTEASSISSHPESSTLAPVSIHPPSGIHTSQQPQLPLIQPEKIENMPMIPGGGDQQQSPMFPSINLPNLPSGGGDLQPPMFPSINLPGGGGDLQPPMFPSINLPGGGGDLKPPMFPSINLPNLPGGVGDLQPPMFPSVNFPSLPGSQPMIPSNQPSVPSGGQHQQSLLPPLLNQQLPNRDHRQQQALIPSLNPSSVSGSPHLPHLTPPSNLNLQGMPMLPNGQIQMHNQNHQQNLQNLASSSVTAITSQSNGQNENNQHNLGGWITPQQFPEQQHPVVKPTEQGDSGWAVPDNFPTFYSVFPRVSPIFLSSVASNPSSLILI